MAGQQARIDVNEEEVLLQQVANKKAQRAQRTQEKETKKAVEAMANVSFVRDQKCSLHSEKNK